MMWSVQSQLNLVQPFLDLLFEVCHIVLGLRPQCKHLESNIGKIIQSSVRISNPIANYFYLIRLQLKDGWNVKQVVAIKSVNFGI